METSKLETLQDWIDGSSRIVFFGGAGVSTESGIPVFRSVDGLYNQSYRYPPETIISHSFFEQDPEEFFRFYREKMLWPQAQPNPAHRKLAELEQAGKLDAVVTQNHRNYCMKCHQFYGLEEMVQGTGVPRCKVCGGIIKPDVVLYEESLDQRTIEGAVEAIRKADLLIIGGTSLAVYPAAGLIQYYRGSRLVLINKSATPYDRQADLVIQAPIGALLEQIQVRP